MSHAIDNVTKFALGLAGVVVLTASANTVSILAEAVTRAVRQVYNWATNAPAVEFKAAAAKDSWDLTALTPYSTTKDWQALGMSALLNVAVATVTLFVAHKFCPSLVTHTNSVLGYVVPIKLTPDHIPLTRLFGL
jgi:hypothetical protein